MMGLLPLDGGELGVIAISWTPEHQEPSFHPPAPTRPTRGQEGRAGVVALAVACGMAIALSGCDLLVLSPTMPGFFPGLGRPLTGQVLDSQTGLPIGHATVLAGWGSATTDNTGHFNLYGDFSGGRSLSVARAGYTSSTYETGKLIDGDTYYIDPTFSTSGDLTHRALNVTGTLKNPDGSPMTANGNVSFGGAASTPTNTSNGQFAITVTAGLPGNVFSGVLAGGEIVGGPVTPGTAPQAFYYQTFGYRLADVPSVPTGATWAATANIQVQNTAFAPMNIVYNGLQAFKAPSPETDVTLDFGLLGSVPVGRGFSSNQTLSVPRIDGAKYVIAGDVKDGTTGESLVTITTNFPTTVQQFNLLAPPQVTSPSDQAKGVGGTPTFSWNPVPRAVSYFVVVSEDTGSPNLQAKWKGYTANTSIRFPGFWGGDLNGGGLFNQATYSWSVHAVSSEATTVKSAVDLRADLPTVRPFRQSQFESITGGLRFSP